MIESKTKLLEILQKYNPWWSKGTIPDLPTWKRTAFTKVLQWTKKPPVKRALLLSGARQIGKTTLMLQTIKALLDSNISPKKIIYITFDHPLIKQASLDELIDLWYELEPATDSIEYLFLDEIQYANNWQTWLKHQVDFFKKRHIVATGSATPLVIEHQESGVGRWHTLSLATFSFFEYLQIKKIILPELSSINSFSELFNWKPHRFLEITNKSHFLTAHFHQYLLRGGFPQTTQIESITQAQQLLREDILDKVLKRDMTALFGVRRIFELEQVFLYLCLQESALIDIPDLCKNLSVKKPTINNFISLLEATHLIYRVPPFGYGKEILRARYKIYLADAAIAPSIMLQGKSLLSDPTALGIAGETACLKHLITTNPTAHYSYWRGKKDHEVDTILSAGKNLIPIEVKYRARSVGIKELQGLHEFCEQKKINHGYVITKTHTDFSIMKLSSKIAIVKIPAPLACYWMGEKENLAIN